MGRTMQSPAGTALNGAVICGFEIVFLLKGNGPGFVPGPQVLAAFAGDGGKFRQSEDQVRYDNGVNGQEVPCCYRKLAAILSCAFRCPVRLLMSC